MVLLLSLFLITCGLLLTAFSLFSPIWQVAVIEEQHVTHQHGLWWDCIIPDGDIIPLSQVNNPHADARHKCTYKFDPAVQGLLRTALERGDATSREFLLHRFLPQHKAVIFFAIFTFLFGLIGLVIGICSPCFPPNSLLYVVAIFMTGACSILADVIFLYAAYRKETRFAPGLDGNYPNKLGLACYVHCLASVLFVAALVASVTAAYLLITVKPSDGYRSGVYENRHSMRWSGGVLVRACDQQTCKPFVIVSDDSP